MTCVAYFKLGKNSSPSTDEKPIDLYIAGTKFIPWVKMRASHISSIRILQLIPNLILTRKSGHRREFIGILLRQIYFTFVQSIGICMSLGLLSGMVFSFQAHWGLAMFGGQDKLGELLVYVIFREITPIAAALLLIARSVTAMASELATMKVGSEIDALDILGIDTHIYLWAPRVYAGAVSLFCMSCVFWGACLLGSWFGSNLTGYLPMAQLINSVVRAITIPDLGFFILKTSIPGGLVFYLACNRCLLIGSSPHEVPIATNQAVVDSLVASFIMQFSFSAVFYFIFGF